MNQAIPPLILLKPATLARTVVTTRREKCCFCRVNSSDTTKRVGFIAVATACPEEAMPDRSGDKGTRVVEREGETECGIYALLASVRASAKLLTIRI
jgi:hypothetical protein